MRERNREQIGEGEWRSELGFGEGEENFWVIGIGFDSSSENRNSFFLVEFFFNNTDILKIMMTWTGKFF